MSGRISDQTIDEVRDRSDIVDVINSYVPLKRRGGDYWACCPFHREKSPSFKVSAGHQTFHCFGCQKSGNVFHFVMERENLDFIGAVRLLARRAGILIPDEPVAGIHTGAPGKPRLSKEKVFEVLASAAQYYQRQLREPAGQIAADYLATRGLPDEAVRQFGLGYSPDSWDAILSWGQRQGYGRELILATGLAIQKEEDNPNSRCYDRFRGRLMFPIWDELGRVVGFSARTLETDAKTAKYINSPETAVFHKNRILYGIHLARTAFKESGCALICEGQLDVIACHRAGVTHAVAPQGTAFTENHARLLKRFTNAVVFAFDADPAGQKAAAKSVEIALEADLSPKVVTLPQGDDPDSLLRASGPQALQQIMASGLDAFEFLLALGTAKHDPDSPDGKAAIAKEILPALMKIADPVARAARTQWLGNKLGLPESAIFDSIKREVNIQRRKANPYRPAVDTATQQAPPPKPSPLPQPEDNIQRAEAALLDLALRHDFIAQALIEKLPPETVSDTPLGHALNMVIAMTAQGEWSLAAQEIGADHELAAEATVTSVLMDSSFKKLHPELAEEHHRPRLCKALEQAMADCLAVVDQHRENQEVARLEQALETERDSEKLRQIMRRLHDIHLERQQRRRA